MSDKLLRFLLFLFHGSIVMLTAEERLRLIRVKVERAKKHIRDLEIEVKSFLDANPYVVSTKSDPQIPQCEIYYLESVQETPEIIGVIAGDVLFNLRAALDHLAHSLIDVNGGSPTRQTGFPIINTDSPTEYEASRRRKVQGMSQAAIDAIDAAKPYKGGNDTLWQLSELNNIDKHRLLITVGSSIGYHSVPEMFARGFIEAIRLQQGIPADWDTHIAQSGYVGLSMRPVDRKCPLKVGDELALAYSPILKTDEKVNFIFVVAINEPQIIESEPLLPTLVAIADRVDDLITNFRPLLA